MEERTTGVVLRTFPLTETSLIVHWLTPDRGRLHTVAKGARRPKSPFRGKLDLFYECDFTFVRSRRSDLHTLREVAVRDPHAPLRQELAWLAQASYAAALIAQTTETEAPLPTLHATFCGLLAHLPRQPARPLTVFALEMKLLADLGLGPNLAAASLSAGARQLLGKCLSADWPELFRLQPSTAQTAEIRRFLHDFLLQHLGRIPVGRQDALADQAA